MPPTFLCSRMTPLMIVAGKGNIDGVKLFLDFNADPNAKGQNPKTALMYASERGHLEVAKLLLQHGADINAHEDAPNVMGASRRTALMYAAKGGHTELSQLLLDHGAKINAKTSGEAYTALLLAIKEAHTDTANLLLQRGADPNVKTKFRDRRTALILAAQTKQTSIVKKLIDLGVDLEESDANGQTALIHAAKRGYLATTRQLLLAGADSQAKDAQGRSALYLARGNSRNQIVALLTGTPSPDIGDDDAVASPALSTTPMTVTEIWQTNSPDQIASGPFIVGNKVIFTTWAGKLIALRSDTGVQLWTMDVRQGGIEPPHKLKTNTSNQKNFEMETTMLSLDEAIVIYPM